MKIFDEPNLSHGWKCRICKTSEKKKVVLIGIVGTEDGHNMEAEVFHLDSIDLVLDKNLGILYQRLPL